VGTAKVIPSGSYDFTIHHGYLKQHKASPSWEAILKFNYTAKTYLSHKKKPNFPFSWDVSVLDNKNTIRI
jgi:hypothetical protein